MQYIPRLGCSRGNSFLLHSTLLNIVCLGIVDTPFEAICNMYTYRVHNLQDIHKPGNREMRDIPRPGCSKGNLFLLHITLLNIVCLDIVDTPFEAICKMYTYRVHNLQDIHKPGNRDMQDIPRPGFSRGLQDYNL